MTNFDMTALDGEIALLLTPPLYGGDMVTGGLAEGAARFVELQSPINASLAENILSYKAISNAHIGR